MGGVYHAFEIKQMYSVYKILGQETWKKETTW